jgi:hypothetical protein
VPYYDIADYFVIKQLTSVEEPVFCKPGECVHDGSDNNTISCVKCKKLIAVFYLHDQMISPGGINSNRSGIESERKRLIVTESIEHDTIRLRVSVDSIDFGQNLAQTYTQLKCSEDSDTLKSYWADESYANEAQNLLEEEKIQLKSGIFASLVDGSFNVRLHHFLSPPPPFDIPETIPDEIYKDLFTPRLTVSLLIIIFSVVCLFSLAFTFYFIPILNDSLLGNLPYFTTFW